MKNELRKIEFYRKRIYKEIGLDGKQIDIDIDKKYGYFHKWVEIKKDNYSNVTALVETQDGLILNLDLFDYQIKFINEFPRGKVLDMKIDK